MTDPNQDRRDEILMPRRIRRIEEMLSGSYLPTADRDAIREALRSALTLLEKLEARTHTYTADTRAKLTAALALIGEG